MGDFVRFRIPLGARYRSDANRLFKQSCERRLNTIVGFKRIRVQQLLHFAICKSA